MAQDIPRAVVELKEKANGLYRNALFSDAISVYTPILQQFGDSLPAPFTRVIRCNLAACFIELQQYENALKTLDLIFWKSLPDTIPRTSDAIPVREQEADPIFRKAYFRKARCLSELGSQMLALEALKTYCDLVEGKVDASESQLRVKILHRLAETKQSVELDQNTRPLRYEIFVNGDDKPIVKHTTIPSDLCCRIPPRDRGIVFIVWLMDTFEESILNSQPDFKCWNCGKPATSLAHTPRMHFERPPEEGGPLTRDYVYPICAKHSECEILAGRKGEMVEGTRPVDHSDINADTIFRVNYGYAPLSVS